MSLFEMKKDSRLELILDIQSLAINATLVMFETSGLSRILFAKNIPTKHYIHAGNTHLIRETLRSVSFSVDEVMFFVHKYLKDKNGYSPVLSFVHCALSSPWIVSQAKTVSLSFKNNTRVTKSTVMDLLDKERAHLVSESKGRWLVVEEKIYDVRLNGYPVLDWQKKETRMLETAFVVSVAGVTMIDSLRDICERVTDRKQIFFHSSILLRGTGFGMIHPNIFPFVVVHPHGELTDVVVMNKRGCLFIGSYPIGLATVVRRLSNALKADSKTAESALVVHGRKHFDHWHGKNIALAIERISKSWIGGLHTLFLNGEVHDAIPRNIVLIASKHGDFFGKIVKDQYPKSNINISLDDVQYLITALRNIP